MLRASDVPLDLIGDVGERVVACVSEKRATWRRITIEGDAWRFNRYRERAQDAPA